MSRFRNRQTYLNVFPEFGQGLVGTEYQYQRPPPPPQQSTQGIKQLFGEVPTAAPAPLSKEGIKLKKTLTSPPIQSTAKPMIPLPTPPIQPTAKPDTPIPPPTTQTVSMTGYTATNKYDASLHQKTPKSQLDIPIKIPLLMTYPQNVQKYKYEPERYGYFVDPLSDQEHIVLYNPSKKKVVFGVRGTDVEKTEDIFTDIASVVTDIKTFNRYKKAQEKYKQVKSKFNNIPITLASHSLGGLISSVLAEPEDKIYTYNRPYFSYPIRKNEVAISVESDPLLFTLNTMGSVRGTAKNRAKEPIIIPRTYYSKAKDYLEVEKAKINPNYEEKPITIPQQYKTDLPNVLYKNVLKAAYPAGYLGYVAYDKYISRPEVYRQQQIQNLRREASLAQESIQRVRPNLLPTGTSPRTMEILQRRLERPLSTIEENTLNPTFLDTTKRIIGQIIRNPQEIGYNVLTSPPIQYAAANYLGGYVSSRATDSHSIDNLPLKIRIE
jgi:hypothetical protein